MSMMDILPIIGPVVNGTRAFTHAHMASNDHIRGDRENRNDHLAMMALDTAKAIPGIGGMLSAGEFLYDQTHGQRVNEAHLFDPSAPAYTPTVLQNVREWMFGRRRDGRITGRDTTATWF